MTTSTYSSLFRQLAAYQHSAHRRRHLAFIPWRPLFPRRDCYESWRWQEWVSTLAVLIFCCHIISVHNSHLSLPPPRHSPLSPLPPSPFLALSVRGLIAPVVRNQTHHLDVNLAHCNCEVKRQIGELATPFQGPVQFCLKRTAGQQVVHSVIVLSVSTRRLRCPSVIVLSVSTRKLRYAMSEMNKYQKSYLGLCSCIFHASFAGGLAQTKIYEGKRYTLDI
jgi:hypothetical protein